MSAPYTLEHAPVKTPFFPTLTSQALTTIKGDCVYYRSDKTVRYACGFTRTLGALTVQVADTFRWRLVHFGRKNYYLVRKGESLIKSADQKYIISQAKALGLQADEYFDGYVEGYDWG